MFVLKMTNPTLSNPEHPVVHNLEIAPNPTDGAIRLSIPQGTQVGNIRLLDALGREIKQWPSPENGETLTIDGKSGLYFLQIE